MMVREKSGHENVNLGGTAGEKLLSHCGAGVFFLAGFHHHPEFQKRMEKR
jgi:hypothetical protein